MMQSSDLESLKIITDIVTGWTTIIALAVGAVWTYLLFIRKRTHHPRAGIGLSVESPSVSGERLVHVRMRVDNPGAVLLAPKYGELRLRQVVPLPEELTELGEGLGGHSWPLIVGREWHWEEVGFEIEPGESDEILADFLIPADIETIQLYAFIRNPQKRSIGWKASELFTFETTGGDCVSQMIVSKKESPKPKDSPIKKQQQQEPAQKPGKKPNPKPGEKSKQERR